MSRQGQQVLSLVLERPRVEVRGRVLGRVVVIQPADESKVPPGHPVLLIHGQIRVVGHALVHFISHRRSHGMRQRSGHLLDQPAVAVAGLEHERRAGVTPRVEIEDDTDVPGPRMLVGEDLGAVEAGFFAVVDQDDDVALGIRAGLQGAKRLEDRGDARGIVTGARATPDRIIMGREQQRLPARWTRTAPSGDDIDHVGLRGTGFRLGSRLAGVARALDLGFKAQSHQLLHDVVAHRFLGDRADRVRLARDRLDVFHGAHRRERLVRRIRGKGAGRSTGRQDNPTHHDQERNGRQPGPQTTRVRRISTGARNVHGHVATSMRRPVSIGSEMRCVLVTPKAPATTRPARPGGHRPGER
jgi:hypothetical protein